MRRVGLVLGAVIAAGCVGLVGELPPDDAAPSGGRPRFPEDAGGGPGPPDDAGGAGEDAGGAATVDGGVDVGVDAGADAGPGPWVYPGLPASCQGLRNRTHGTCDDAYANPNYGSVAWAFKADVEAALVVVGQPAGFFDGDTVRPEKRFDYAELVSAAMDAQGLCAVWDGAELYVRDRVRDMNETFSLFTQAGRPRAGGHWQCAPSDNLPRTRPAFTCSLPAGTGTTCGAPGSNFFSDLEVMVDQVIAEEQLKGAASEVVDFAHRSLYSRGWRLKDDGYPFVEAVARKANGRGYCVQSSGWKWIGVKQTNALSEKYSLVTHVSLPDPAQKPALYQACLSDGLLPSCEFIIVKPEDTCRPADF